MNRDQIVWQFCEIVNQGLAQGLALADEAVNQLAPQLSPDDQPLLEALRENFRQAYAPSEFFNAQVLRLDHTFYQCYELMSQSLDSSVVDPVESFVARFEEADDSGDPPVLMWGRFWMVSGAQQYDADGRLQRFDYNPLVASRQIAAMINADYLPLPLPGEPHAAMGGIGQMATRPGLRGQGHANALVQLFEEQARIIAQQRGHTLKMMVLEAEKAARRFWARMGYRYPQGARYYQPPIAYDHQTGEPITKAVPEMIMVKFTDGPAPAAVDRALLVEVVRTLYERWYLPDGLSDAAREKVESHLFGTLFADFLDSLPDTDTIPLIMPPED